METNRKRLMDQKIRAPLLKFTQFTKILIYIFEITDHLFVINSLFWTPPIFSSNFQLLLIPNSESPIPTSECIGMEYVRSH